MRRPPWEVADIIRLAGRRFLDRCAKFLSWPELKVLQAIERCRTAALGGHRDECERCGHQAISYNSCRNRHCPKCQTNARDQWSAARQQELLPADYYHLVFSVPHALIPLIWQNKKVLFKLLFDASAQTLLEVASDPKHLGAESGFLSVLHTWGQTLQPHPHIHCVVPGGGLSPDHQQWIRAPDRFFLPVKVLSRVFRGKFVAGLKRAFKRHEITFFGSFQPLNQEKAFATFLRTLFRQDWVVYAKKPFGGPEHVLHYLARYTHRVAISNHRLVDVTDTHVSFRWKDYAHHSKYRLMTLSHEEFLRRFLLHVLPRGSPASVTSVCSPIDGAGNCYLFAGRSYSHVRSRFRRRLPHHRFYGSAPAARDQCAWLSDLPQTKSTGTKVLRWDVLTALSMKPLTARRALLGSVAPPVCLHPRIILFVGLRAPVGRPILLAGSAENQFTTRIEPGFPGALTQESAFKPHS